jgi:hypothetical protein
MRKKQVDRSIPWDRFLGPVCKHRFQDMIPDTGVVYGLSFDGCTRIKIGYTTSIVERLATLDTGSSEPLGILAMFSGIKWFETSLHRQLHDYRQHLEWFDRCYEVEKVLVDMCMLQGGVWVNEIGSRAYDVGQAKLEAGRGRAEPEPFELPEQFKERVDAQRF